MRHEVLGIGLGPELIGLDGLLSPAFDRLVVARQDVQPLGFADAIFQRYALVMCSRDCAGSPMLP